MLNIYGTFRNTENELIEVSFRNQEWEEDLHLDIGQTEEQEYGIRIMFGSEPVIIERHQDNLFTPIIKQTCKINLVTNTYLGDYLFATNAHSIRVYVRNLSTDKFLFRGYVEPNTFSQPYAHGLDEFTFNCIDGLSTLQYIPYKNIKTEEEYNQVKSNAEANMLFADIIHSMLVENEGVHKSGVHGVLCQITQPKGSSDPMRAYVSTTDDNIVTSDKNIFHLLGVSEHVFLGNEYDDLMTCEQVLNEILRYLDYYVIQDGRYYIFFYMNSSGVSTPGSFADMWTNETIEGDYGMPVVIRPEDYLDDSTNITIDDVYNQVILSCNTDNQETLIKSPADSDYLSSKYSGKQIYMDEYISEGSGDTAYENFNAIVRGEPSTYAKKIRWYIQAVNNQNWRTNYETGKDLDSLTSLDGTPIQANGAFINQWAYAAYLKSHTCVPYMFKLGSHELNAASTDTNVVSSKLKMEPYLYISINGNEVDTEGEQYPSDNDISSHSGMLQYVGTSSGGTLSPPDKETTNYIVFSGKILLQPIVYESSSDYATRTNNYLDIKNNGAHKSENATANVPFYDGEPILPMYRNNLVKSDNNGEGRYYTRQFYHSSQPTQTPPSESDTLKSIMGVQPWTKDKSARGYMFNYSAAGDGSDQIKKLPILECQLIIGDKYLVETNLDSQGNSIFGWYSSDNLPYWRDSAGNLILDENNKPITKSTFSLGINPNIGDYIIGDEFDIQNNITISMNIDAEGTAIPISYDDHISGAVSFSILGPINNLWNDIVRRHPTFFRHTKWYDNYRFILSHVENIIVKDFECKIYTNNGNYENSTENDLIYMSDEQHTYIRKKDDLKAKIITQPTSAECIAMGITTGVYMNSVLIKQQGAYDGVPVYKIFNTKNGLSKAEESYVSEMYNFYNHPKVIVNTTIKANTSDHSFLFGNVYKIPYMTNLANGSILMESTYNVRANTVELTLREP